MYSAYLFLFSVFVCVVDIHAKRIPSYITLCKRNDPELEKCILRAVDVIKPHLKDGIPDLGIPSLNPLKIPFAGLDTGPTFNASFKDIEIYNIDQFKVEKFEADLEKVHLELGVSFPKMRIMSQYTVNGKLLFIELRGSGAADGNFTNVHASAIGDGNKIQKNGKTYLEIQKIKVKGQYGKPVFYFADLFENPEVTDQTNKLINENIEEIIKELDPVINDLVIEIVKSLVSRIFSRFSFDELFPL